MSLREKLLLAFLSLSLLILTVGMIFYAQLQNMIEPISPQSIPRSVEKLGNVIDQNDYIYRLLFHSVTVNRSLEKYVYTNKQDFLEEYYINDEMLYRYLELAEKIDIRMWKELAHELSTVELLQDKIIQLMKKMIYMYQIFNSRLIYFHQH